MSIKQRRNSQRLASTLDALSADLDFVATNVETETDQNIAKNPTPKEYWGNMVNNENEAIQLLGEEKDIESEQNFESAFQTATDEDQKENCSGSVMQGDPGVQDFGSQSTFDTDEVRQLGDDYGVDFDGDQYLQDSIRQIPGRTEKQAKIKELIARIENVANQLECTGRKALAYRLDIVCNNLQAKYLNK